MGNADRSWWISAVEALLCVILAVAFVPWYVALILPYDARYGSAGQVDMAFAGGCLLLLLGGAAAAALKVAAARRRQSERRRAAEGLPCIMTEVEWPLSAPANGPVPDEASVEWPATLMVKTMVVVRTLFIAAFIVYGASNWVRSC